MKNKIINTKLNHRKHHFTENLFPHLSHSISKHLLFSYFLGIHPPVEKTLTTNSPMDAHTSQPSHYWNPDKYINIPISEKINLPQKILKEESRKSKFCRKNREGGITFFLASVTVPGPWVLDSNEHRVMTAHVVDVWVHGRC